MSHFREGEEWGAHQAMNIARFMVAQANMAEHAMELASGSAT